MLENIGKKMAACQRQYCLLKHHLKVPLVFSDKDKHVKSDFPIGLLFFSQSAFPRNCKASASTVTLLLGAKTLYCCVINTFI